MLRSRFPRVLLVLCLGGLLIATPVWAGSTPGAEAALHLDHNEGGVSSGPLRPVDRRVAWALLALLATGGVVGAGLAGFHGASPGDTQGSGYMFSSEMPTGSARPAAARPRRSRAKPPEPPRIRLARYCHGCGVSLRKDDTFCWRCGARRRGA